MPLTLKRAEWTGERSQWVKLDDEQVGTLELESGTEQQMSFKDSPTRAQFRNQPLTLEVTCCTEKAAVEDNYGGEDHLAQ